MSIAAAINAVSIKHHASIISFDNLPWVLRGRLEGVIFPWYLAAHFARSDACDVIDAASGNAWVYGSWPRGRRAPLLVTHSHGLAHVVHERLLDEVRRGNQSLSWKYPLYNGGIKLWEEAQSFRVADLCLFLNSHDRDYAINKLRVSASRCRIVVNGIAAEFLDREPIICEPDDPVALRIAQIGSYIPRKGIAYGTPALNRFLRKFPMAHVSFFGTGCAQDQVFNDFDAEVRSRVFVRSKFVRSELPDLLKDHHVLLFPSLSEGFGMALVEGMACGLCPVASRIPGPMDIVRHEVSGLFVPPADAAAIETALLRLVLEPDLLKQLRIGARHRALRYTWAGVAAQRLELYQEAAEWRKRGLDE